MKCNVILQDTLARLNSVIQRPDARANEDNTHATENAVSAMGRILRYQPATVNLNEALPVWLSYLPITEDEEEASICYDTLLYLTERYSLQHTTFLTNF